MKKLLLIVSFLSVFALFSCDTAAQVVVSSDGVITYVDTDPIVYYNNSFCFRYIVDGRYYYRPVPMHHRVWRDYGYMHRPVVTPNHNHMGHYRHTPNPRPNNYNQRPYTGNSRGGYTGGHGNRPMNGGNNRGVTSSSRSRGARR